MAKVTIPLANSLQAYDVDKPLVGSSLSTAAGNQEDMGPLLRNAVVHKSIDQKFTVTQRPKFDIETAAPASPSGTEFVGQGVHYLPDGKKLIIQDGALTQNDTAVTGALPTGERAYFADYDTDKCGIKIDDELWLFNGSTNALTEVTDGWDDDGNIDAAIPVEGLVYLDDYMFVLDETGRIYNSNNNDFATWDSSTDFLTAERNADKGKAIFRHYDHVGAISQKTIEFFYDAANATGSPLSRRTDIFHTVGTPDGKSVASLRDTTCFIGQDEGSNYGIYAINQFNVTKVSDSLADLAIRNAVVGSDAMVGIMVSAGGKDFYIITFLHSNSTSTSTLDQRFRSYVFDLNDKVLMEWNTNLITKGLMPVGVTGTDGGTCRIINFTGEVLNLPHDTIAQDSNSVAASTSTIDMLIRTYPIDLDTHYVKFWENAGINGYHAQDTATNGLDLSIQWSDDLGATLQTARTETLTNEQRAEVSGLGSSRHRVWYISTSSVVRAYLQNLCLNFSLGEN